MRFQVQPRASPACDPWNAGANIQRQSIKINKLFGERELCYFTPRFGTTLFTVDATRHCV